MEVFGYLVLCMANIGMSLMAIFWLLLGGFEIGNVFTSKDPEDKYLWSIFFCLNVYFWYLLLASSPFSITVR